MRVVDIRVKDVNELVVRARTPRDTAVCPVCEAPSERVHGYHWRTVADVPVDEPRVVVRVRVRRLVCPTRGDRHTLREQVPGGETVRCAIVTRADFTATNERLYDQYIPVHFAPGAHAS